jgi:hypothetical protein
MHAYVDHGHLFNLGICLKDAIKFIFLQREKKNARMQKNDGKQKLSHKP